MTVNFSYKRILMLKYDIIDFLIEFVYDIFEIFYTPQSTD